MTETRRNEVFQIRVEPELRARLDRLRTEQGANLSVWARRLLNEALDRELPEASGDDDQPAAAVHRPRGRLRRRLDRRSADGLGARPVPFSLGEGRETPGKGVLPPGTRDRAGNGFFQP